MLEIKEKTVENNHKHQHASTHNNNNNSNVKTHTTALQSNKNSINSKEKSSGPGKKRFENILSNSLAFETREILESQISKNQWETILSL